MNNLKNICLKTSIALLITLSANQNISAENVNSNKPKEYSPSAEQMIFDGLVLRPLSLAGTIVGTGIFVVTLPFSLLGGNVEQAGKKLVVEPAEATFTECLGCLATRKRRY